MDPIRIYPTQRSRRNDRFTLDVSYDGLKQIEHALSRMLIEMYDYGDPPETSITKKLQTAILEALS